MIYWLFCEHLVSYLSSYFFVCNLMLFFKFAIATLFLTLHFISQLPFWTLYRSGIHTVGLILNIQFNSNLFALFTIHIVSKQFYRKCIYTSD